MKMLEREGFRFENYVDIFDGGPTMSTFVDQVRTIREARQFAFEGAADDMEGEPQLAAAGKLHDFIATYARVTANPDGSARLDRASAELLRLRPGDSFLAVGR